MDPVACRSQTHQFIDFARRAVPFFAAVLFYFLLTVILTWPMIIDPSSSVFGERDVFHNIWILWHTKEAILQQDGWLYTSYLFYPQGISLWVHPVGPVLGFVALPFWSFGPETAYNITLFVGFWTTGIAMYVLARELGFSWPIALFIGTLYISAPLHLYALQGHIAKVFLAMLPLSLWAYHRALSPNRTMLWSAVTALIMLLTLLISIEQFVFAGLAFVFYGVIRLLLAEPLTRRFLIVRLSATAGTILLICGLPLMQIWRASHHMGINVAINLQSFYHHPDLLQLFVPFGIGRPLYGQLESWLRPFVMATPETTIFLTWTAIVLAAVAVVLRIRPAREWVYFSLVCIIFSLGPHMRVMGRTEFTNYDIPVIMPYALATSIPGLDHMRTPGRFMLIGTIGVAIVAGYGLAWILERLHSKAVAYFLIVVAITMPLLETWTDQLKRSTMPPISDFYHQIAAEDESYGIFDLPVKPEGIQRYDYWHIYQSSMYQMFQMVHRKGITAGYLSRYYATHPIFAQMITENFVTGSQYQNDVFVDNLPASRYANMMYELARNDYRYVIVHKTDWSGESMPEWGASSSQAFIDEVFDKRMPIYEDNLITVYEVDPLPDVSTLQYGIAMLEPSDAQPYWDTYHRRIQSPAQFVLFSPTVALVHLELELDSLFSIDNETTYDSGVIEVRSGENLVYSSSVMPAEKLYIPLVLQPGSQVVTIAITENPPKQESRSSRYLHAKIAKMNLNSADTSAPILNSSSRQQATLIRHDGYPDVSVALLQGWYGRETTPDGTISWNWAESPASLAVHSADPSLVTLTATPVALHAANSPTGKGNTGTLLVRKGNEAPMSLMVETERPFTFEVEIVEGWNVFTLELEAGNFQPSVYEPALDDRRLLSFALSDIEVRRVD